MPSILPVPTVQPRTVVDDVVGRKLPVENIEATNKHDNSKAIAESHVAGRLAVMVRMGLSPVYQSTAASLDLLLWEADHGPKWYVFD
ncbi:hypothetical protein N7454_008613 [Penicillium verhagenii]|nr:hypothetical protein N7454_008613 [Penicillium verhagenii]